MSKRIIAWVNKTDKNKLSRLTDNIYFATSLEDFETNLSDSVMPLFSLGLAGKIYKKVNQIIEAHSNLIFFFLDKRTKNWSMTDPDFKVRMEDNTEKLAMKHEEAVEYANTDKFPESFLKRSVIKRI